MCNFFLLFDDIYFVEQVRQMRKVRKGLVEKSEGKDRSARSRRGMVDSGDSVRFHLLIAVTKNIIVSCLRRAVWW